MKLDVLLSAGGIEALYSLNSISTLRLFIACKLDKKYCCLGSTIENGIFFLSK